MLNVPGGTPQGTSPASARQLPPEAERPGTRAELQAWIRQHLNLPQKAETELNAVIDHVITRQERLWQVVEGRGDQGAARGVCRADGRAAARDHRARHDRQQHLALLRAARERADRQDAARPQDEADEPRALHGAARVVSRARAAHAVVRGGPGGYHRIQVVQRRARPRGGRPHHRARRHDSRANRSARTT